MATHRIIEFDDLMLEGEVYALLEQLAESQKSIKDKIPDEILYQSNGEPNVRTHWGAVLFHISMARASLKAFT